MENKRKIILIVLGVLIMLGVILGVSYAFLKTPEQPSENTKGNLNSCAKITFTDNNESISLTNTAPMSDRVVFDNVEPYQFTVSSTCEAGTSFSIYLSTLSSNTLDAQNIKYGIRRKNDVNFLKTGSLKELNDVKNNFTTDEVTQLGTNLGSTVNHIYQIYDAAVSYSHDLEFELFLWVSSEVEDTSTMGKTFNGGLLVKSTGDYVASKETFYPLADYIKNQYINEHAIKNYSNEYVKALAVNEENLYYHDSTLANSANDNSYRYAGNNPNNYVCFGTEDCSKDTKGEHLYRIIGLFDDDKDNTYQVKLIKSEYLTASDLNNKIKANSTLSVNKENAPNPRVIVTTGIAGFFKTGASSNVWGSSSDLFNALNSETDGYLAKLGSKWSNMIQTVKWNVGVADIQSLTPPNGYAIEITGVTANSTINAKVGLLYVTEYAYATTPENWTKSFYNASGNDYRDKSNTNNNWLFNGIIEWLISRNSTSDGSFRVNIDGGVYNGIAASGANGIRPTFTLLPTTNIWGGDGSIDNPYRISSKKAV